MSGRRSSLVLALAALAAAAALGVAATTDDPGPGTFEERVQAVAATLRCPVCQNLSVADSDSAIARSMRREIAADLRAGATPEEIRREFVAAYGEWILQTPPAEGLNLIAWAAPVAVVLAAILVAVVAVRRWTRRRSREGAAA